jgi:hypothetical protein
VAVVAVGLKQASPILAVLVAVQTISIRLKVEHPLMLKETPVGSGELLHRLVVVVEAVQVLSAGLLPDRLPATGATV